jgi:sugar phosphate isomerase/epimerase
MPKLAFSANAFKKNTLPEAIHSIASIGYRGVEIMADMPHLEPGKLTKQQRADVLQRVKDEGLVVSNVNAFTLFACGDTYHPTWIEDSAAKRQTRVDHTLASVELAAAVGVKTVSLQPGGPLIGTNLSREQAAERYAEGLAKVVPLARQLGITLGIEPEPGLFIQTAGEYLEFKNQFFANEPTVLMNCDIGHLFCVGDDPATVIRTMPRHIAHIHLEDIGDNRVHQHLTPGKGAIDFRPIFQAMEDIGYTGWATVELYPYETTAAGVAKLAFDHLAPMVLDAGKK